MQQINGINTAGTSQLQQIGTPQGEDVGKGVGQLGSHAVKTVRSDPAQCERAIASFLAQTDGLGRYLQEKMPHAEVSTKSLLSREINLRASEWIDTMSTLADDGVPIEDLDKMSHRVVDELKTLVDRTLVGNARAKTVQAPAESAPAEVTPPLREAAPRYRARAAAALSKAQGREIAPEKTHVYENIGGGSCFFHSVMQLLAKSDPRNHPAGNTTGSANRLREALIRHVRDLKVRLERGETLGLKAQTVMIDGEKVTNVSAKTSRRTELEHMHPITEGFDLALHPSFGEYSTMADVSTAALLADYLQRPVVVVAQTGDGTKPGSVNTMEFKYGLTSGAELAGEPLVIYYDQASAHFMAVDVEK